MSASVRRTGLVVVGCFVWLTACETNSTNNNDFFSLPNPFRSDFVSDKNDKTGSTSPTPSSDAAKVRNFTPSDPNDELSLGKENFREGNYGLAERYFRKAVETGPNDAEAWLGLAASYDRLRRFDMADRAYEELIKVGGPTPEILNNRGYSYMLRGQFDRAREILLRAAAKAPDNPYIKNNLALLEESVRARKAVR
jgi:Flp pilus assembly protein TadD